MSIFIKCFERFYRNIFLVNDFLALHAPAPAPAPTFVGVCNKQSYCDHLEI